VGGNRFAAGHATSKEEFERIPIASERNSLELGRRGSPELVTVMSETLSARPALLQRTVVMVAAVIAGLFAGGAVVLWAHYGAAVFYEIILAGLNACF
jgi:hypothetical protein